VLRASFDEQFVGAPRNQFSEDSTSHRVVGDITLDGD
jgi:hypothetical protein